MMAPENVDRRIAAMAFWMNKCNTITIAELIFGFVKNHYKVVLNE